MTGRDYEVSSEDLDDIVEDIRQIKNGMFRGAGFVILEDLDLEQLKENDERCDTAWKYAKENYPEYWVHGNRADYDQQNGLSVVAVGQRKYLVCKHRTEVISVEGEYFGTIRYRGIRSWLNGFPTEWGDNHLHLYKIIPGVRLIKEVFSRETSSSS